MTCIIDTLTEHFDYDDPQPDQISLIDIAESLAKTCRWRGFIKGYMSVAEHAVLVHRITKTLTDDPLLHYAALHHDDHEAYVGDMPTPFKRKLGQEWQDIVLPIDKAIAAALGVDYALFRHPDVQDADRQALIWEAAILKPMRSGSDRDGNIFVADPSDVPKGWIKGYAWGRAAMVYLTTDAKARKKAGLA